MLYIDIVDITLISNGSNLVNATIINANFLTKLVRLQKGICHSSVYINIIDIF
jgi:hypothetical protein